MKTCKIITTLFFSILGTFLHAMDKPNNYNEKEPLLTFNLTKQEEADAFLYIAVNSGITNLFYLSFRKKPNVNAIHDFNNPEYCKIIFDKKPPKITSSTVLGLACSGGILEFVKILLKNGADPNLIAEFIIDGQEYKKRSPLAVALIGKSLCENRVIKKERKDIIKLLIKRGAQLAECDPPEAYELLNLYQLKSEKSQSKNCRQM